MAVYVVQVMGGRETHVVNLVTKLALSAVDECFAPTYEFAQKRAGEWIQVRKVLFPGYIFIVSKDGKRAMAQLRRVPAFTKMLGAGEQHLTPLTTEELTLLETFTTAGDRLVPMSTGVIEGDRVIVVRGPLKGHEALISKVDRHKRLAYLDMHMFGRTKTIKVGLEIVRKKISRDYSPVRQEEP